MNWNSRNKKQKQKKEHRFKVSRESKVLAYQKVLLNLAQSEDQMWPNLQSPARGKEPSLLLVLGLA